MKVEHIDKEDLAALEVLSEATIMETLKRRYLQDKIYTYIGDILVAINPYKRFPIYTQRVIKMYIGKRRNEVPPHIFCISDGAYMDMLTSKYLEKKTIPLFAYQN